MVISQIETRNMRKPALGLKRDLSEESAHFSLSAPFERLFFFQTIHMLQFISSKQLKLLFHSFKTHCHKHTVPQTQTNSVSLYLHYFSFRLEEKSSQVKSSQVTFIYIALLTIQIVTKQLHNIKMGK